MNKQSLAIIACGAAAASFAVPSFAAEDENGIKGFGSLSGSLLLATNYFFRSISNSNNGPQVRGDLTWSHPIGVYAGVWASNTDFGGAGNSVETDPYIGYAGSVADTGLSYDVGYWSYNYPRSESDLDYAEIYAIGSYTLGKFAVSPSLWYAPDYFGNDFGGEAHGFAYDGTVSYQIIEGLSASARIGQQTFGSTLGALDYYYWDAGLSQTLGAYNVDLRWYDSNGVEPGLADPDLAEGEFVLALTRSFD